MSQNKVFLTTGPFHVPDVNQNNDENNRIVISVTNPTDHKLEAVVKIEAYTDGSSVFFTLPAEFSLSKTILHDFGKVKVDPRTTTRLEAELPPFERSQLRVVTKGDYKVEDGRPVSGKLEISSVVGYGNILGFNVVVSQFSPQPGLHSADAATFFSFSDFVVDAEDAD